MDGTGSGQEDCGLASHECGVSSVEEYAGDIMSWGLLGSYFDDVAVNLFTFTGTDAQPKCVKGAPQTTYV